MPTIDELLDELPDTFRYSEALEQISERQLRRLLADGRITAVSRGLYRKSDWLGDDGLIEIAAKSPQATICLRSALARHDCGPTWIMDAGDDSSGSMAKLRPGHVLCRSGTAGYRG